MLGGERISRKEAYCLPPASRRVTSWHVLSLSVPKGRDPAATLYLSAVAHERLLSGFPWLLSKITVLVWSLLPVCHPLAPVAVWSRESCGTEVL